MNNTKKPIKNEEEKEKKVLSSQEKLETILKENKTDHYNFHERVNWKISTGSLLLDAALGGGINPSLIRVCGHNNEGKTPQTLEIMRQFLATVPNSKGFWMIAEGRGLSEENRERCGLKFVYSSKEWVPGTVFVLESNVFELFVNIVKDQVLENPENIRYCYVIDSIDGLMLKSDKEKAITENNRVAGVPSISKKMLQSLSLGMFKFGHLMVLLSQVTAEIKMDEYAKSANRGGDFSGGNSLLHGSDWIFEYQRTYPGDFILDNNDGKLNDGKSKALGKMARVIIQKSALEKSRKLKIEYPIQFGRKPSGVWREHEIVLELIRMGLLIKTKGWLSFEPSFLAELKKEFPDTKEQINGLNKARLYLEENPKLNDFLYTQALKYAQIISDS
jgi:hypothetical protein